MPTAPFELLAARVRDALVAKGHLETRPMPFVKGADQGYVRVANPLSENEAYLRRDVLESLVGRAEHNLAHMRRDVRLFEVGAAFAPGESRLPREEWRAAALIMGRRRPAHWTEANVPDVDEWDAKAVAEGLAATIAGSDRWSVRPAREEGATNIGGPGELLWEIEIGGEVRGGVRRIPLDAPVWAAPAFGVEVVLGTLDAAPEMDRDVTRGLPEREQRRYRALPATPAAEFDVALLVPETMQAERVEQALREGAGELLERLELLSEYRGTQIPDGVRSVAWRLTLRHPERTLREKEIAGRRERLLRLLEDQLGVRQRT